jgi:hypothetical protein
MRVKRVSVLFVFFVLMGCGDNDDSGNSFDKDYQCNKGTLSGDVVINGLDDMESISGYTGVSGRLTIEDTQLKNLDGLSCLEYVGGILDIESNEIVNIDGLSNLQRVDGNLHIKENLKLSNIDGLHSLVYAGKVSLEALFITDLDGLDALTSAGSFTLDNLFNLQNVDGLSNLKSIEGSLHITKCRSLQNLDGLDIVETVGRLRIVKNDKLPTCEVESLADRLISDGFSGDIEICENAQDECGSEACE